MPNGHAEVGAQVRLVFDAGAPNATSPVHVIGELFDRVNDEGAITDPPLNNVPTTTLAPGGAIMLESGLDAPGRCFPADHALSRMEKGLAGSLFAEGEENPVV